MFCICSIPPSLFYLCIGSVPFLLKEHLSYSQLATFALSSYPYSLKLLWSPIVDSVFIRSVGRRKSWIIPMQLIVGTLMLYISLNVQKLLDDVSTFIFLCNVIFYHSFSRETMLLNLPSSLRCLCCFLPHKVSKQVLDPVHLVDVINIDIAVDGSFLRFITCTL